MRVASATQRFATRKSTVTILTATVGRPCLPAQLYSLITLQIFTKFSNRAVITNVGVGIGRNTVNEQIEVPTVAIVRAVEVRATVTHSGVLEVGRISVPTDTIKGVSIVRCRVLYAASVSGL